MSRVYKFPCALHEADRMIGGKRFGKEHRLDVRANVTKITIEAPKGTQLELDRAWRAETKADDFGPDGKLTQEAVFRLIHKVVGPQIAIMGHAAFGLAHKQAADDNRAADGRFEVSPTILGDVIGYRREPNGKASSSRISRDAAPQIRRYWDIYAGLSVRLTMTNGDTWQGNIVEPTSWTRTLRRLPGQKGRDRRQEWRIATRIWERMRQDHVVIPLDLLHKGESRMPMADWAHALRVYEVIAYRFRRQADRLPSSGELNFSFDWLIHEANVTGEKVRDDRARAGIVTHLERLAARGACTFSQVRLTNGQPGVTVRLAAERLAELLQVRGRGRRMGGVEDVRGPGMGGVEDVKWGVSRTRPRRETPST